jgi:hypothetical protein
MPELPEVEALAAFLRTHASGHVIARAEAASSTCPAVICTW